MGSAMEDLDTVVLVTVPRTWGSSPRPPGSLMAINDQGATSGSVSGGCIEDDLIDKVRQGGVQALCAASRPSVLRYGISADEAHRFGLPCGRTIELVLEPVSAISRLDELLLACQQRRSTRRVLDLKTGGGKARRRGSRRSVLLQCSVHDDLSRAKDSADYHWRRGSSSLCLPYRFELGV